MDIMATLKKFFPISFKYLDTVKDLIIGIVIYLVAGAVAGVLLGILGAIPIIGLIFRIVGGLIGLYVFAGIVIQILLYTKVIK